MAQNEALYERIHGQFNASISERYDCGRMCAPLNGGEPVCCTTENAIPFVHRSEWNVLRKKTDLWERFRPADPASRKIIDQFPKSQCAVTCKGARFCERENRTLACRSFPFFPYFNREKELLGLTVFWNFANRCWVISNLQIVERTFIKEFLDAYELLCGEDEEELQVYLDSSAYMRRAFSRRHQPIPILARDGKLHKIQPHDARLHPAQPEDFPPHKAFSSDQNYRRSIAARGYKPGKATLSPDWSIKDWWNTDT